MKEDHGILKTNSEQGKDSFTVKFKKSKKHIFAQL